MAETTPSRRINTLGLATMAGLITVWEVFVRNGSVEFDFLPPPSAVAEALWKLIASGDLLPHLLHTVRATLLGWGIASVLGVGLGLWLGLSDRAWRNTMASIEVMRAIPPISLVPVAFLVFGFSMRMELVLIVYVGAWTVLINTIDGVRGVRAELLDVVRMLRMSRLDTIRKVVLPGAMAPITVGLRLALSLALVLAVVAEMIGNPAGLGNALVSAQQALQPEQMFAYVVTIGLLGVGLNLTLRHVLARLLPALAAGPGSVT